MDNKLSVVDDLAGLTSEEVKGLQQRMHERAERVRSRLHRNVSFVFNPQKETDRHEDEKK
jgi:hypothetical protein